MFQNLLGSAIDNGDVAVARRKAITGYFWLAQELGVQVEPAEQPLLAGTMIELTPQERSAWKRLLKRVQLYKLTCAPEQLLAMTINPDAAELEKVYLYPEL